MKDVFENLAAESDGLQRRFETGEAKTVYQAR